MKIKESSVLQEDNITQKLYADYSKFREAIYNNLVKNNPETDKLLLFKKTQKLLDRFLFIFFAEDRLLVPPNSISQIIEKWKDDVDFGDTKPLYYTFKKYFHVLIGLEEFSPHPVFDPSLFVEIRKRIGNDKFDELTKELIHSLS